MSIEKTGEGNFGDKVNQLGYRMFREGSVRRFNPGLFAVRREDRVGWFLVELKEGKWMCDCGTNNIDEKEATCPHIYAALLSSAIDRVECQGSEEMAEERPIKCRYCGSPDISKVGFRYNARQFLHRR